jgi:hypothetical protein
MHEATPIAVEHAQQDQDHQQNVDRVDGHETKIRGSIFISNTSHAFVPAIQSFAVQNQQWK